MNARNPNERVDAARALVAALPDLSPEERHSALRELTRICGVDLGQDQKAWSEWIEKHLVGQTASAAPSAGLPGDQLRPSSRLLVDLLRIAADQQAADENGGVQREPEQGKLPHLEGYELLSRIGEGGMGTVYRARQLSLRRTVAVKILRERLAGDEAFIARFMREARLAAALSHPNIVRAIDVGSSGGKHYFVMEFVDGETAKTILRREGALPEGRAAGIVLQIADALEHARAQGLIHRDVKPENILIDGEGAAMLADMGLARVASPAREGTTEITRVATMMGTPDYVSPEQARCQQGIDTRTDVYSLGATLFHMVTGRPPFTGESQADVISKHLSETPPAADEVDPRVSAGAALVIRKAMEKDRNDRYETPGEMASDIEDVLRRGPPRIASEQYGAERTLRAALARALGRARRSKWGVRALIGAAVVGMVAGIYLVRGKERDRTEGEPEPLEIVRPRGRHEELTGRARGLIADGDYDDAIELLGRAEGRVDAPDMERLTIKRLIAEANRGRHMADGRSAEERGDLRSAIRAYELALAIEDNAFLRGRVEELSRQMRAREAVLSGDRRAAQGDWKGALERYRAGLAAARDRERSLLEERTAEAERRGRYADAMASAREAFAARRWEEAVRQAEAALAAVPGEEDALALVAAVKKGREEEREERRRRTAYAQVIAEARKAVKERAWQEAITRAEAALALSPGHAAAEEISRLASEGRRREQERKQRLAAEAGLREQREKAYAEAMADAERARNGGDWRRAAESARWALSAQPEDDRAQGLMRLADVMLYEELSREQETAESQETLNAGEAGGEGGPPLAPGPVECQPERDLRFGARCGLILVGEPGWEAGWRAGAYYRGALPRGMPLELGLDFGGLEREDAAASSHLIYLRADVVGGKRAASAPGGRKPAVRPTAGLGLVYEHTEFRTANREADRYAPTLNLGLRLGAPSGRWDVQALYSLLVGRDDVAGEGMLALGVCF